MRPIFETEPGGAKASPFESPGPPIEILHPPLESSKAPNNAQHAAMRGFAQIFGLHPAMAFLIFVLNSMLFAATWGTLGALWPVSVGVGGVVGYITYKAQREWYGDNHESAKIKALIVALLMAIPVPIPAVLSVPAGFVGLVHTLRRR